ncbi:V-type proton ATPase subunit S1 isoform X1 [Struthio camelus]|uniref:V-type proton ATPase subunit S1 isoform X1 n=1 Tax=Struthio camelus TaxID=8801 RepID=UPI003603CE21
MAAAALALALGLALARAEQVPLLAWSSHSSLWPPPADSYEGHVVTEGQLRALLAPALERGPHNVLLFLQEKLSVEDFTAYGGVYGNKPDSAFPNLEGALGGAPSSLVLPAVAGGAAGALPRMLAQALGAAPLRVDGAALRQLRLNASLPALLLVRLPHTAGSSLMAPKEVLTSNDEIMGQVLSALKEEDVPYTALLTALRPSRVLRDAPGPAAAVGPGRQLLQREEAGGAAEVPPPLRWPPSGTPQILLWASNFTVAYEEEEQDLTARTFGAGASVDLGGSSWDPQEARLVMKYDGVFRETLTITLVLRQALFAVSGRRWGWLSEVGVALGGAPRGTFNGSGVAAPTPLGWRCGRLAAPGPLLVPRSPGDPAARWRLLLQGLQVQAFNVTGPAFGAASDCAGFFAPGVWMGLVTGALLLGGLGYGLHMLLGLRTMDRFDDPKGPSIAVPQSE